MSIPSFFQKSATRLIFLCISCLPAFTGCNALTGPHPEKTERTTNHDYEVDMLFTDANGCKVYRFYDCGEPRYYVFGPNGAQMLPTTKTVTETVTETQTVYVDSGGGGDHKKKH